MMDIQTLSIDGTIKQSLMQLSKYIDFDKYSEKGANGYLFFGKNAVLKRRVAVKYYYWGGNKDYHAEPQRLAQVKHTNVIDVLDAAVLDNEYALFVTPYCEQGDLDDMLKAGSISYVKAITLTMNLLNGLSALHAARFVHRDLKPENILLDNHGQAIIGDFGSVRNMPDGSLGVPGSGHSILYRPPESFDPGLYGFRGDLYQCGIILYQLLGGYLPYDEISWLNRGERKSIV